MTTEVSPLRPPSPAALSMKFSCQGQYNHSASSKWTAGGGEPGEPSVVGLPQG